MSRPPLPEETKSSMNTPDPAAKTGVLKAVKDEPSRVTPKNIIITLVTLPFFTMFETKMNTSVCYIILCL